MASKHEDSSAVKVKELFERSGLTLHELGIKMGYTPDIARQSAWQFLKSGDPRISMLRRFAIAAEVKLEELVAETKLPRKRLAK